jgi:hypothetical protein
MMMPLMTGMEFYTRLAAAAPQQVNRIVFTTSSRWSASTCRPRQAS